MPSIDQLRYLVAVAEEKHFGNAARKCHVAQPSLSVQIQKLEEELGVIIFDRSKKPILITDIGAAIIDQARTILRQHQSLRDIADMGNSHPKGTFHLGIIPTLSSYLIPQFLPPFSKAYPDVELSINEYKTEEIIRLLVDDKLDAGILVTPLKDSRLIERHLFFEPFYVYASPQHPLTQQKMVSERALSAADLWLLEEGHCFRNQVLRICRLDKSASVLPNVKFESGNLETLKKLVQKSHGYTLLPQLAANELGKKEVAKYLRPFKAPVPTREVSLVYSRSFLKEQIMNALEQAILQSLPANIHSLKKESLQIVKI